MKKIHLSFLAICVLLLALPSCASIFCGTKAKVTLSNSKIKQPVDITTDVAHYEQVTLPYKVKVKRGYKPSNVVIESEGYKPANITILKSFNAAAISNLTNIIAWGIDAGTGALMKPEKKAYTFSMEKEGEQPELVQNQQNTISKKEVIKSDVDQNIPQSSKKSEDTYALIIANEDYQFVDDVNFAAHDGEVFKEYCIKTLGVPERQIRYCANASYGVISGGVDWLKYALNNFEGCKAIVYYCGHGIPDEKTGDAYIIPVDGKGTNTTTCYSLNTLYTTLANTKASNITYFMDACFTGANKEGSMLVAARGVAREAKKEVLAGKAVVFSASSGDETAMTYPEKGHGLFTYFLLKKLQETQGNVSYSDLADYINKNVKKEAFLINEKPQTPVVATSTAASSTWKNMTLK
ncbi:MAG: caspase family protein [Paludibacteraceae bacterium]|nr:caspase family protein [Paludibacteraceae bacterium]